MNLREIWDFVSYVTNKELVGASFSPSQFNTVIATVNIEYLNSLLGNNADLKQGVSVSKVGYDINSINSTALNPLKKVLGGKDYPLLKVDSEGYAIIPDDYFMVGSIVYKYINGEKVEPRQVEILKDDMQGRRGSKLIPPSHKYPVCYFFDNYIKFLPETLGYVEMIYVRKPQTPYFDYVIDNNDEVVYIPETVNGSKTVQFEYYSSSDIDIIRLILKYVGINLKAGQVEQFIQGQIIQGK